MRLKLTIGPMFSGKSTEGICTANHHAGLGGKVLFLRPGVDTRDGVGAHSFSSLHPDVVQARAETIASVDPTGYDAIVIDESQFFNDLTLVTEWEEKIAVLHVCGLDGDYMQRPFPSIANLIPYADEITKRKARCLGIDGCGCPDYSHREEAVLTQRTVQSSDLILIGAADAYRAVCRSCSRQRLVSEAN